MRFFLSVGEPSGDLHGGNLIRALRRRDDACVVTGFGGPKMAGAGCQLLADMSDLAIMGIIPVLRHLPRFWSLLQQAEQSFRDARPDAVILIDYPGFNWWIARRAKAHGIPVFYYGTPQLWAWASYRVRKLRRLVDHVLCKLPFEPEWYRERNCSATYVGHPYFDDLAQQTLDEEFVQQQPRDGHVVLLPGSRRQEVAANLPSFLKTIEFVAQTVPQTTFSIASYSQVQAEMARQIVDQFPGMIRPEIYVGRTRELIRTATCCLACSGSVSLELLYEEKPTVIHYRIGWLGDFLQRHLRRCRFITLVNLLSSPRRFDLGQDYSPDNVAQQEEAPFPEYLTKSDCAAEMAHHLIRWLLVPASRERVKATLRPIRELVVAPGASERAAAYVLDQLQGAIPIPTSRESQRRVA